MDAFAALADPVRRDLLVAVATAPMRVVDLAAHQAITRPAVSRHLRLLLDAGLVEAEDRGRERHYRLHSQALGEVQTFLDQLRQDSYPAPLSANALDALDTEVRRAERDRRTSAAVRQARPKAHPPREDIA
jgi:DNA-binding transcriptional ArsR family regulator